MKTDDLKIYLNLAQSLSFFQTAKACYLSPSTLSRLIQRMEEELGCALFFRTNKHVSLTPEGERFCGFAQETLTRWGNLKVELSKSSLQITGKLSLFCSVTAAYSVVPTLLDQYRANYPDVEIDLEVGSSPLGPQALKQKDLIIATLPEDSGLNKLPLAKTPLVFVGKKPMVVDWHKQPIHLITPKKGQIEAAASAWAKENSPPHSTLQEVGGSEAVLALVALGCGVGVVPQLVLEKSPLLEELEILKHPKLLGYLTVYLARDTKPLSPAAQVLWEMVSAQTLHRG